jgi:hypothetical protein
MPSTSASVMGMTGRIAWLTNLRRIWLGEALDPTATTG